MKLRPRLLDEVISGDMGNLPEVTLKRPGEARGHGLRTRAWKLRLHQDGWKIDLGRGTPAA